MITLTRGIGDSLLSLTSKGSAEPPAPTYEPETLAFESRVLSDGGKILDIEKLDRFIKANKSLGIYANLQFAVSKQFGYKLDGLGNIIKIYDASKNGNDLDISRGVVPEDLESDMFYLYDTFAKLDNVIFDNLNTNNAITFISDLIPPIQEDIEASRKVGFSIGDGANSYIYFFVGGRAEGNNTSPSARLRYSSEDGIIDMENPNPQVPEKQNSSWRVDFENKTFVNYRNGELLINSTHGSLDLEKSVNVQKIVLGGANNESTPSDADCYLNNTFFYNKYLTDQELEDINDIL